MSFLIFLFGSMHNVNSLQIASRTVVVVIYTIFLMRIAGRRAFGLRYPFDNVILILLGAILGRAVVAASPFVPTLVSGLVIALMHRVIGLLCLKNSWFSRFVKGTKIVLVKDGHLNSENMKHCLISKEDLEAELRITGHSENVADFKKIFMECNGGISLLKRTHQS